MSQQEVLLREDYHGYVLVTRWNPELRKWEAQAGFLDTTVPVPQVIKNGHWKWEPVTGTHVKIKLGIPQEVEMSGPFVPGNIVDVVYGRPGSYGWKQPTYRSWTSRNFFEHLKRWIDSAENRPW